MSKEFTFQKTKNLSVSQKKLNDQLYLAAKNRDAEITIKLLKQGADPFEPNEHQSSSTTAEISELMDQLKKDKLQELIQLVCNALRNRRK